METFSLTTPQKNIWNLQKYYTDTSISNICGSVIYEADYDYVTLNNAVNAVIASQEALRLRICANKGIIEQYAVEAEHEAFPFVMFQNKESLKHHALELAHTPMNLIGQKLYRIEIIRVNDKNGILVCLNHLIADAWSFAILARMAEQYCVFSVNKQEYRYSAFSENESSYLSSKRYLKDQQFWENTFHDKAEICSIKPETSPAVIPAADKYTFEIGSELSGKIKAYCERNMLSPAVLFESALFIYLSKLNPECKELIIGNAVLNRTTIDEKSTVGMFISTLPLKISVSQDITISELSKRIMDMHTKVFRHQKYPYSHIAEYARQIHGMDSLYQVMFSYQNAKTEINAETEWYSNGYSEVPFVLHVDDRDGTSEYTLTVDYQTDLFKQEEIEYICKRLLFILAQMIANTVISISEISIIPPEEYQKLIFDFNDTAIEYPRDKCVHELFAEQVRRTPDKTALIFENKKFTYKQIDEMSNSLAHFLREEIGVRQNDIVPVIADRKWQVIVAMLGCIKSGCAYTLIDCNYPDERIASLIADCNCPIILSIKCSYSAAYELSSFNWNYNTSPLYNINKPTDTFCAIHTSGSTGKPKLAQLSHRNIINFTCFNKILLANVEQVISATIITFDAFIQESIVSMCSGVSVVLCSTEEFMNQKRFEETIMSYQRSFLFLTPTKMMNYLRNSYNKEFLTHITTLEFGGEIFTKELYDFIFEQTKTIYNIYEPSESCIYSTTKSIKTYNGYGPSEATFCTSCKEIQSAYDITIGKPIANTQVYILDRKKNLLPIGIAGELCISGDGVGKGYLNNPKLTAEKFISNPFDKDKVMYCTGDLARWRTDGEIEYLGRIDTQVKIRGLRIELGEIESVMSSFEGINLCAVTDKRDENNRQYLVGYYTADTELDEKALRRHLSAKLPKYMIPNYFVRLEAMPMTASGKTDRKNLPLPDFTQGKGVFVAPRNETEQKLCDLMSELLNVKNVGITDDFFDLGGDSLLAITMLSEIENRFEVSISVTDIYDNPNAESLSAVITNADSKSIIPVLGNTKYELMPQQKAIYAYCRKYPDSLAYNMPAFIPIPDGFDKQKIQECFTKLFELHPELCTRIITENNSLFGVYDTMTRPRFEEYQNDFMGFLHPFDLSTDCLIRIGFTKGGLLFDMHHIIADGTTLDIILHDLMNLYNDNAPADNSLSYADYSAYFYNADFSQHKAFFRDMLKCDFEPTVLPEKKNAKLGKGVSAYYTLDSKTVKTAKAYAAAHGLTDTMLFFGIWLILLSKYTAKADILTSVILTNRVHSETRNTVGMFVNTLPVYLKAEGQTSEFFAKVKEILLGVYKYQELPFFDIAETVGMTDKNMINTSFVYQADGEKKLIINGNEIVPQMLSTNTAKFDLTFELTPQNDTIIMRAEYNSGKFDAELVERLFEAISRIISQLDTPALCDISVLSEQEYRQVIYDFNDTAVEYPRDKCVHELFSEQAEKTPDKVALIFEHKKFTYKQLDEMSNAIAHFLREEKGIKPNDIVPIIAKRSWHIIVAMLGILKAGGAYMPVDPTYPVDRILYMMSDTNSSFALKYGFESSEICCESLEKFNYCSNIEPIHSINSVNDICYLICTSGSTGKPKGVMITHANAANYVNSNKYNIVHKVIKKNYSSILSVTNIVFDIFVTESLMPLVNGLTIYFANDEQVTSQKELSALILNSDGIDVIQTTPTKMRGYMLDKNDLGYLKSLKAIILGGEALTSDLASDLKVCTDAEIFNIYGPAETTVWVTNAIADPVNITIGKPIANTQIYILDRNRKPLPIGVAGELCISGDSVGKGYLNNPELTLEKFVPNPFIDGKTMYCTGDLARWCTDGEIEYLGRIDTQVKIRGLRIELGEIESIMSNYEGINLCAVTDKRDENKRQYLVGYYTADTEIDEKALRKHLSAKLPKYMIPNYFVRLDEMPMTASGKTDRKNLPLPDFTQGKGVFIAPRNETEQKLCALIGELLSIENVGITDDFFELGGDSLGAMTLIAEAHNEGIEISLQDLYDHPTIESLFDESKINITYSAEQYAKYEEILQGSIIVEESLDKKSLGNVLLTGATGFLGAHVFDVLMKQETGKVFCLVRSKEKFIDILHYYFGKLYDGNDRIIPVIGDVTDPHLADILPRDVQTIIHTAANVKHYGAYSEFEKVNVDGTRIIIEYTKSIHAKLIHISTISVSGNTFADAFIAYRAEQEMQFDESCLYIGQSLENVYVRSKFEAECAVLDAVLDGLDAKIVRIGNLTNRTGDYKFQPNYDNNAFLTRVCAGLKLGILPDYLLPLYTEFSPVDDTADGIVRIGQYAKQQTIFHLNSNKPIYFTRLIEVLQKLDIPMNVVSGSEFRDRLEDMNRDNNTMYLYKAFQNDMDNDGNLIYDSNIRILNDITLDFLQKTGFEWPEIDFDYIKGYLEYFRKIGILGV